MRQAGHEVGAGSRESLASLGQVALTDAGLVKESGAILVRMRRSASGFDELALDQDRDRLIALMSIAANRRVVEAAVLPHIEAAAVHWQRGDKALANLRLIFAGLSKVSDPTSLYRVALAEHLLDSSWSPRSLMIELGLAGTTALEKYNPNHVPAGSGRRSGQFDFSSGVSHARPPNGAIVVAGGVGPPEDEKSYEERRRAGLTTLEEDLAHGHSPDITTGVLTGVGPQSTTAVQLAAAAKKAAEAVGTGRGPVYGTKVHTGFQDQVKSQGHEDLYHEQSYLNGASVKYGTPGSVRVDVAQPSKEMPHTVYDLKTGGAKLTESRKEQFRTHLPKLDNGEEVQIHEIRP